MERGNGEGNGEGSGHPHMFKLSFSLVFTLYYEQVEKKIMNLKSFKKIKFTFRFGVLLLIY